MISEKILDVTITLGSGEFGEELGDTVTLSGFRMTADCTLPGGDSMGRCQLRIYGLREDVMNKLTTIGAVNTAIKAKNTVSLSAGDVDSGMGEVFIGTILDAWADYSGAPDVGFNIVAFSGAIAAVKPVAATSYKGVTDVGQIMSDIAGEMDVEFINNGVDVKLLNPYLPGTALSKIRTVAQAANINWVIDRNKLFIWPVTGVRQGGLPLISPETGMVGYPALSSKGMTVKMIYNPAVVIGGDVEVQSAIPMACGIWRVFSLTHNLSSQMVGGPWFTISDVYNVGQ
jgi:hypothetical protein